MKQVKYFSAKWCGPCKVFKPVMEELSSCHRKFLENDEIEIRYIVGQSKDEKLFINE